jgi:hypothetical protein
MPAVIDTPELLAHVDTHNLTIERPQVRYTRPGFWRMLVHGLIQYLTPTPRERYASSGRMNRPFETPMDRFEREYPSLSLYALAIF